MRRLLVLLLLLAGCRASSGRSTTTTSVVAPAETTTTTAATTTTTLSEFAVPAVIDLPYVQRVLEAIYHLDGEATRHAYATKAVDAEVDQRLEAIFGDPVLTNAKRALRESAAEGFSVFANPPGDAKVRAVEIIQATPTCIIVRANLDYGPQFKEYRPPRPEAIIQMARADILPYNPTGWGVTVAGEPRPGQNLRVCR